MDALLTRLHAATVDLHGSDIDLYSLEKKELLGVGKHANGSKVHLPQTYRAKGNRSQRKTALLKKADFFSGKPIENLYSLLIPLKVEKLYSKSTELLSKNLTAKLIGDFYYWVERGKTNGVHTHVILHSQKPPAKRITLDGAYFSTNPRPFNLNYPTLLESMTRTVMYSAKTKDGRYRADRESYSVAWSEEVTEALEGDRERAVLTGDNLGRKLPPPSPEVLEMWNHITSCMGVRYSKQTMSITS